MPVYQLGDLRPVIGSDTFIADNASLIGQVRLGDGCSVWFGAVIRADNDLVSIGHSSNVQENAVLHTDAGLPMHIGHHVTIGHQVMLHGCTIGDNTLIGIQSVILNRARIGKNCIVGAGSVVMEGKEFPDNSLILGSPARVVRTLDEETIARLTESANSYRQRAVQYLESLLRIDP